MMLNTVHFGEIEVDDKKIIEFFLVFSFRNNEKIEKGDKFGFFR